MNLSPIYIVLPRETIPISQITSNTKLKTVKQDLDITPDLNLRFKRAGTLLVEEDKDCKIAVIQSPIRYFPEVNDYVIVQISGRNSDFYFCDLGNGFNYNLNQMDFEGATKKNRPNLQIGQYLFTRIIEVNQYLKGRLSCINPNSKKEWTTGENLFRELADGIVFDIPLYMSEFLLGKKPILFKEIGKHTTFESCVGRNGKVWIKGQDAVLIMNIVKRSIDLNEEQQIKLVSQFESMFIK